MEYRILGDSGIRVSRLCFGSLTIGPLQAKLPVAAGAAVLQAAFDAGVTFVDTAQLYRTYAPLREALKGRRHEIVVASKSYAYDREGMRHSVEEACRELGRDYVDIFLLHEQESYLTLKGHREALTYLLDAKKEGLVRAVGISTHAVAAVHTAALMPEIDIIHPMLNCRGIGILDGGVEEMLAAIRLARAAGKGLYTMKALGGGHLCGTSSEALRWVLAQPEVDAVAVGMQCAEEVAVNAALFAGENPPAALEAQVRSRRRRLLVEEWCIGCGSCLSACPQQALSLVDGQAVVDASSCLCCGYCGARCPEFCIKII